MEPQKDATEVGRRLRHKHIRTLELLQKVLEENERLKSATEVPSAHFEEQRDVLHALRDENQALTEEVEELKRQHVYVSQKSAEEEKKLRAQILHLEQAIEGKRAEIRTQSKESQQQMARIMEEFRVAQTALEEEAGKRASESVKFTAREQSLQAEIVKIQSHCDVLERRVKLQEEELSRKAVELKALRKNGELEEKAALRMQHIAQAANTALKTELERVEKRSVVALEQLNHTASVLAQEKKALQARLEKAEQELQVWTSKHQVVLAERDQLTDERDELASRVSSLTEELDKARSHVILQQQEPTVATPFTEYMQLRRELARIQDRLRQVAPFHSHSASNSINNSASSSAPTTPLSLTGPIPLTTAPPKGTSPSISPPATSSQPLRPPAALPPAPPVSQSLLRSSPAVNVPSPSVSSWTTDHAVTTSTHNLAFPLPRSNSLNATALPSGMRSITRRTSMSPVLEGGARRIV